MKKENEYDLEREYVHTCIHCGKGFDIPKISTTNYYCPHCSYHYPDSVYDEAKIKDLNR